MIARDKIASSQSLKGLKCLVLGSGGFIGWNLMLRLHREGARVCGYSRSNAKLLLPTGIPLWKEGLLTDVDGLAEALAGQDVVFHLIGSSSPLSSLHNPAQEFADYVGPTIRLLDLCTTAGVKKLIFASSGGTIYGPTDQTPIPETAPLRPVTPYGVGKASIEHYLHMYKIRFGLQSLSLRVANPYGPYQSPYRKQGVVPIFIHKALIGERIEIWGDGGAIRDFIYINDLLDAFIAAIFYEGAHDVFNVGSGRGTSIKTIVDDIAHVLKRAINVDYQPFRSVDAPSNVLDVTLILQEMGWRARTPLRNGLQETADWLRENGSIINRPD